MMNERIRELVRQAGLDDADFPIEDWDNVPLARYTELIVRECAQIAKEVDGDEGDDYKSGRTWAGIDVLKHFGVEE